MIIAILSDLHIGYEKFADDAYLQAEEALASAVKLADIILIPGDIFHKMEPGIEVLSQVFTLFRNAVSIKPWEAKVTGYSGKKGIYTHIPIVAISGTHERKSKDAENAVDLLSLAGLIVNASEAKVTIEKEREKLVVWAFGGVAEEKVLESIAQLGAKPDDGAFNVFMFHQSVYELLPFDERFIKYNDLPKGFDLYVNGHIHSRVEHKVHGKPFLIPGSTVLTQLKDSEQDRKGFYTFDTKIGEYAFHEIHSREFRIIKINAEGRSAKEILEDSEKEIEKICSSAGGDVPIIRIALSGKNLGPADSINLRLYEIVRMYKDRAIIEIDNSRMSMEEVKLKVDIMRQELLENSSVKDLGAAIFVEKLMQKGYSLGTSPIELFEILSQEGKEKAVAIAFNTLFES